MGDHICLPELLVFYEEDVKVMNPPGVVTVQSRTANNAEENTNKILFLKISHNLLFIN